MNQSTCPVCSQPIIGRSDKKTCSAECKRVLKRVYDIEYHQINAAKKIATACDWQRVNLERKRAYDAEYRERTRDHRLARKRRYGRARYWSDVESSRLRAQEAEGRRRARLYGNGVFEISPRDKRHLLASYRNACAYCHAPFGGSVRLEWDHVIPVVRGGRHSIGNFAPSCGDCNRSKSHRTVMEWRTGKVVPRHLQSLTVL